MSHKTLEAAVVNLGLDKTVLIRNDETKSNIAAGLCHQLSASSTTKATALFTS